MLKKTLNVVAVGLSTVSLCGANIGEKTPVGYQPARLIPLNIGFFSGFTTNQSASDFNIALEKNSGWVFDKGHNWLKPQQVWTRVAYKYLIYPLVMGPFYKALRMTTDLYGKASRIEALGGHARYVSSTYDTYAEHYWSMLGKNIWSAYKGVFTGSVPQIEVFPAVNEEFASDYRKNFVSGTVASDLSNLQAKAQEIRKNNAVDTDKIHLNDDICLLKDEAEKYLTARGRVLVQAAGYNAKMQHTRNIEDTLWYDESGHLAQLSNHSLSKLAHAADSIGVFFQRNESGQQNSDLGRIQQGYQAMGVELSWKEMGAYGAVAFLGSAEFWGRFLEEFDYVSSGDTYVRAPEIQGFRLPNLGFYLTSQGPSYQINTGYRMGQDMFFPVALEYVFKGPNKMLEITVGVRKKFEWMGSYLHGEIVANVHEKAFGGKILMGIRPTVSTFVDLGVRFDHVDTLDGERNIRSLKENKLCPSVIASVGVLF